MNKMRMVTRSASQKLRESTFLAFIGGIALYILLGFGGCGVKVSLTATSPLTKAKG
jgi:hypothetical protein